MILFDEVFLPCSSLFLCVQSPAHRHCDEEEEDLNKAFDVQGFHQILSPPAHCPPENHRVYDEQDFEGETLKAVFLSFSGSRLTDVGLHEKVHHFQEFRQW